MSLPSARYPGPAKRSRFEIRAVFLIVAAIIVGGGVWVALNGSPTSSRAFIDSSANPASTLSAPVKASAPAHP